jgi:hypothetical protein
MSLKESKVMVGSGGICRGPAHWVCPGARAGPANQDRRHDERFQTFMAISARQSSREVNICRVLSKSCGVPGGRRV